MTTEQLIPLIVIAVVLPLVLLRNRRPRTLRPRWMWVVPAIVVALIGLGLWATMTFDPEHAPFRPVDWVILAAGLALGAAAGWQRGRTVTIHKDADGVLKAQASPLGRILYRTIFVLDGYQTAEDERGYREQRQRERQARERPPPAAD